jgi:hypothetical protein
MTKAATVPAIYKRLFSRKLKFRDRAGDFLDRLDDITHLINLRNSDPNLGLELQNAIVSGFETIKDLSFYLRDFILQVESEHAEVKLLKRMLLRQSEIRKVRDYEYVVAYEWETDRFNPKSQLTETHHGDLVLMNECGSFLVVELKHIKEDNDFTSMIERGDRIRQVRRQTQKFMGFFQSRFPWAYVEGIAVTSFGSYLPYSKKRFQGLKGIL